MGNIWSQSAWVTSPPLTENNISDQSGKVFIITGANSGAGFQLAKILYGVNAHVYLACRSETRVNRAIRLLEAWFPDSKGILTWLPLDLANLDSIKPAAEHFLRMEKRLDVLWNNAGTLLPQISKSKQGYDLQMSTNTLGHYLLTRLLHPILKKTAESAPANSVRVCWASSIAADFSPEGGIDMDDLGVPIPSRNMWINYCISKAANNLLASEFGKQWGGDNILHIVCINSHVFVDTTLSGFWCINRPKAFNPGNLDTNLTRNVIPLYLQSIGLYLQAVALWPPRYGLGDASVICAQILKIPFDRKMKVDRGKLQNSGHGVLRRPSVLVECIVSHPVFAPYLIRGCGEATEYVAARYPYNPARWKPLMIWPSMEVEFEIKVPSIPYAVEASWA